MVAWLILAATGLAEEAVSVAELWALASAVFVAGIATVVPALLTLIGSRAGWNRGGALGLAGLALLLVPPVAAWRPAMALDMLPMQAHGYWRFEHVGEPGYG